MIPCEGCGRGAKVLRSVEFRGIPFLVKVCDECIRAGAIPYDLLVTLVWMGQVSVSDSWARNIAIYHGHTGSEFESDCANFIDKMESDLRDDTEGV